VTRIRDIAKITPVQWLVADALRRLAHDHPPIHPVFFFRLCATIKKIVEVQLQIKTRNHGRLTLAALDCRQAYTIM
jgi:hypothetical protein